MNAGTMIAMGMFDDDSSSSYDEVSIAEQKRKQEQQHNDEMRRLEIFDQHINLIKQARDLPFEELKKLLAAVEPLKDPAYVYRYSKKQSLPMDGNIDIFEVVAANQLLSEAEKCEVVYDLVVNKNYVYYSKYEVAKSFVDLFLKNDNHLKDVYLHLIKLTIAQSKEREIWDKLYSGSNGLELFVKLADADINNARWLNFVDFWVNKLSDKHSIMETYKQIKDLKHPKTSNYLHEIREIAELRILQLDFSAANIPKHTKQEESYKFLKSSHSGLFCCVGRPTTYNIYKLMPENTKAALVDYKEEQDRLENKISKKTDGVFKLTRGL